MSDPTLPSERPPSDGYGSPDEKFIPMADYEVLKEQMFQEREGKLRALDERDQLREALNKVGAGIHKASEEPMITERELMSLDADIIVKVETWRRCREIAMDLLHVPMGGDNVELVLKLENGYLLGIGQK